MKTTFSNFFVKADNACDYIPVVSTVTNLTDIFQKCAVLPFVNKENNANSRYYAHLKSKSLSRSIILLVPVLGNLIIGIYDFTNRKYSSKSFALSAIKYDIDWRAQDVTHELKKDKDVMFAAFKRNKKSLEHANDKLNKDKDFILRCVKHDGMALRLASDKLKKTKKLFLQQLDKMVVRFNMQTQTSEKTDLFFLSQLQNVG